MRRLQPMLYVLFLIVAISFANSEASAQDKARLRPQLNQSSSIEESLAWLDKTSFANARVGFDLGSPNSEESNRGPYGDGTPSAKVVFSQGFRLARLDGCHLTLRNEAVSVFDFPGKGHKSNVASLLENRKGDTSGQLFMWLERLSYTKGRAPYRHTTNPDNAKLLGTWRTKFTYRGFFARDVFSMSISDPEHGRMSEVIKAGTMHFTFDDRVMSEQFNTAFRQAIRLCQGK